MLDNIILNGEGEALDVGEWLQQAAEGEKGIRFADGSKTTTTEIYHHRHICVMCGGARFVLAVGPMPDKPILCHSCYLEVIPQYPALPHQVVGRYMAGPSFMDEYVDLPREIV